MTTGSTAPAIVATGLRKSYGDKVVLDDIDLTVASGKVFALLGPNGAGKTTIVNILSTLIRPDAGAVQVAGCNLHTDPSGVRAAIAMTGQFAAVDGLLTGRENLQLMADLNHLEAAAGRRRSAELIERFDLAEFADTPASTYSGGMKRRVDLAMSMVGEPRIIFLDEPTTGLDPRSRRAVWQIVRDLVTDGVTIFLTTQMLDEADQLADRIAVLDGGRLIADGSPRELKQLVPGGHVTLRFADAASLGTASAQFGESTSSAEELALTVPSDGSTAALRNLLDRLDAVAVAASSLELHTPDLDDVFLALTGGREQQTEGVSR